MMQDTHHSPSVAPTRVGEASGNPAIAQRSSRLFRLPNGWYFNTREQIPLGPFPTAEQAASGIADFRRFLEQAPTHVRRLFRGERSSAA